MRLPGGEERSGGGHHQGVSKQQRDWTLKTGQEKRSVGHPSLLSLGLSHPGISGHQKLSTGLEVRKFRSAPSLYLLGNIV